MDSTNAENKTPATTAANLATEDQETSASYYSEKPSLRRPQIPERRSFHATPDRDNRVGFRPHHIFLYGSLMDPSKVLWLKNTPNLHPATIVGWKIMLWGQHPALVFNPGNVIHGRAYKVQKQSHVETKSQKRESQGS